MKANAYVNTFLFNCAELSTQAITSGIMVCHPLMEPGIYNGSVYKQEKEIGSFTIVCNEAATETQADIDLFKIESSIEKSCSCKNDADYKVRPGGFVIFFASFGQGSYQVSLWRDKRNNKNVVEYTTAKLQKDDVVLLMLMRPGKFEMRGYNNQTCAVSVKLFEDINEDKRMLLEPVNIRLNDREFSNKEVNLTQGQGLVVSFETEGGLNIKLLQPIEIQIDKEKRHNWENNKYKYPKP